MQREERPPEGEKRRGKWAWLAVTVIALMPAIIVGLLPLRNPRSADERLVEIEAKRAVPEDADAATIYRELFRNAKATSFLDHCPEFVRPPLFAQRLCEPWHTGEAPELASWIQDHQFIIDKLIEASAFSECRFSLSTDFAQIVSNVDYASMRQWAFLLGFAANNDIAEGRIDSAMRKWRCIIQMGHHLRQRPTRIDFTVADAIQMIGLRRLARFVMAPNATELDLQRIEAMPLPLANLWARHRSDLSRANDLPEQKMLEGFSPTERLKFHLQRRQMERAMGLPSESENDKAARDSYLQTIASARCLRILITLRRHQRETHSWPESLDRVNSSLPKEVMTDPFTRSGFIYRLRDDGFTLYSVGPNRTDEDGLRNSTFAPNSMRVVYHEDDVLCWPPELLAQEK